MEHDTFLEAKAKRWMSLDERRLKKKLIELLRDDGHGHHHAKYAERLADFDINILPNKPHEEPITASISFRTGVINIGEGLINNPNTFYQLPTVLRHEMAHNLMMHEVRMMREIGAEGWEIWGESPSLWTVLNWIEDYEISNKKYNDYDKSIMRKLIVNGRAIPCLVTEDNREDWKTLTVEEMFKKMDAELQAMHERLLQQQAVDRNDAHTGILLATMMGYREIDTDSVIKGSLADFVAKGCKIRDPLGRLIEIAPTYKQVTTAIYNNFTEYRPEQCPVLPEYISYHKEQKTYRFYFLRN
jgi:hypothetical protein